MSYINFGYTARAIKSATIATQTKDIGPIQTIDVSNFSIGDTVKANITAVQLLGGQFDFLWGCHLWGDTRYKVTK